MSVTLSVITGGLTGEEIVEPPVKLLAETDSKLKRPIKYGATKRTKRFEIDSGFIKSLVQILAKLVNKFFIHCKTTDFNTFRKQKKLPIFRKASHWLSYEPLVNQWFTSNTTS